MEKIKNQILGEIQELIYELYEAKGFNDIAARNPLAFRVWEADIKERWDFFSDTLNTLEEKIVEPLNDQIVYLESDNDFLLNRNAELIEENEKQRDMLEKIEQVIRTWN